MSTFLFRTWSSKGQCTLQICECVYMWIKTNTGKHQLLRLYFTFLAAVCCFVMFLFILSWITGKKIDAVMSCQDISSSYYSIEFDSRICYSVHHRLWSHSGKVSKNSHREETVKIIIIPIVTRCHDKFSV